MSGFGAFGGSGQSAFGQGQTNKAGTAAGGQYEAQSSQPQGTQPGASAFAGGTLPAPSAGSAFAPAAAGSAFGAGSSSFAFGTATPSTQATNSLAFAAASPLPAPSSLPGSRSNSPLLRPHDDDRVAQTASAPGTPPLRATKDAAGAFSPQANGARMQRFSSTATDSKDDPVNLFHSMRKERERLRDRYIAAGILPDPSKAQELESAQAFRGTCPDMCPEFERVEREMQKELDTLEVFPGTNKCNSELAVKIYRRPAAGREVPLPEDVRPPEVLKRTLDYLFHDLLPSQAYDTEFNQIQAFVWNRTRAIRQDFIVQNERGHLAIECHERITRYHILTLHFRGGLVQSDGTIRESGENPDGTRSENTWSEQQELEQLRKTLRSLIEFYDDKRIAGGDSNAPASPNEGEFRAYNLLLHMRDPETQREVEALPESVFMHPLVQSSLRLRSYAQKSNNVVRRGQPRNEEATLNWFSRFFREVRGSRVGYLQACLAENLFTEVRLGALKALSRCFRKQFKPLPTTWIVDALGFDDAAQAVETSTAFGLMAELEASGHEHSGIAIHQEAQLLEDKPVQTPFSRTIVEAKRGKTSFQNIIDGAGAGPSAAAHRPVRPLVQATLPPAPKQQIAPTLAQPAASSAPSTFLFGAKAPMTPARAAFPAGSPLPPLGNSTSSPAFGQPLFAPKTAPSSGAPQQQSTLFSGGLQAPRAEAVTGAESRSARLSATAAPFTPRLSALPSGQAPVTSAPPSIPSKVATSVQITEHVRQAPTNQVASDLAPASSQSEKPAKASPAKEVPSIPAAEVSPAPSAALARPKASAQDKLEARRSISAKVAESILSRMIDEVTLPMVKQYAADAVEAQRHERKAASQQAKLEAARQSLVERLCSQTAEAIAEATSMDVAAQHFIGSRTMQRTWAMWTRRFEEMREWSRIRRRAALLRGAGRTPEHRPAPKQNSMKAVLAQGSDEALSLAFNQRHRQRGALWRRGSFTDVIYTRLLDLFDLYSDLWPQRVEILASFADGQGHMPGSDWLRKVLSEDTFTLAEDRQAIVAHDHPRRSQARQWPVALVIFECTPGASASTDRARLRELARKTGIFEADASLRSKLLLLHWPSKSAQTSEAVLSDLNPEVLEWPQSLVVTMAAEDLQSSFEAAVDAVLHSLSWKAHLPAADAAASALLAFADPWHRAVQQASQSICKVLQSSTSSSRASEGVTQIWRIICVLGNLFLRHVQDAAAAAGGNVTMLQVNVPPAPAQATSPAADLHNVILATSTATHAGTALHIAPLLRALNESPSSVSDASIAAVLHEIFDPALAHVAPSRLSSERSFAKALLSHTASFQQVCALAVAETERIVAAASQDQGKSGVKRQASDSIDVPIEKSKKVKAGDRSLPLPSAAVSRLQAALAASKQVLR